jgi:hypothetical protein
MTQISHRHNTRFDIEALCNDGSSVKLTEHFHEGKTTLCRGLHGAKIRKKRDVAIIMQNGQQQFPKAPRQ